MPLIYSGQEYDLNKRLEFFMKDTIPHHIGEFYAFYKKLGQLKGNHPALAGGKHPASFTIINSTPPKKLISFKRAKKGEEILYIANITADSLSTTVAADGEFINYITGNTIKLQHTQQLQLAPWEYLIL